MFRDKDKNDDRADNKAHIIFSQNNPGSRQMRGPKRFSQRPVEQMKIDGNNQAAKYNPLGKIRGHKKKSGYAGNKKQDPIGTDDKFNEAFLNFHKNNPLKFSALFYCNSDVSESRGDPKS